MQLQLTHWFAKLAAVIILTAQVEIFESIDRNEDQ